LKFFKGSFRSSAFKLILFSWFIAFIAAISVAPFFPLNEDYTFLDDAELPSIQPAYALFSDLLKASQEQLDETTVLEKINSPFVLLILKSRSVEENIQSKGYGMIEAYLKDIEASQDPYIKEKAIRLRLLSQYSSGQFEPFISGCLTLDPLPQSLIAPLVQACVLSRKNQEAQIHFNKYFKFLPIRTWSSTLQSPVLSVLIKGLPETLWQAHLDQLQHSEQISDLSALLRLRTSPERSLLLEAMTLYNQKEYSRALQPLDRIKAPSLLRPWKEYLRLKIDARSDRTEDLTIRSKQHRNDKSIYLTLLADLGGILIARGDDITGLEFYNRYMNETESLLSAMPSYPEERLLHMLPLSEHTDLYWQIVYRSAWLNYKMDNRDAFKTLLRKCLTSPINGIRQSAKVWLAENPEGLHPHLTPFGYDYARLQGPLDRRHLNVFLENIAGTPALSDKEISQLNELSRFGLLREAVEYCRWLKKIYNGDTQTRNMLAVSEAILLAKQGLYPQAFFAFKESFPDYDRFLLPKYLSFLILPLAHQQIIHKEAAQNQLDPLLVTSLIRQESFFMPGATSPANAYGLMQLLLRTAQETSVTKTRLSEQDLYNPATNIALGCRYLRSLMARYQNQTHLALAAYNAGPERVDLWTSQLGKITPEEFIELIPFSETRLYIKTIIRNMYYYQYYYPEQFPTPQS